jgi:hypothetical protein
MDWVRAGAKPAKAKAAYGTPIAGCIYPLMPAQQKGYLQPLLQAPDIVFGKLPCK